MTKVRICFLFILSAALVFPLYSEDIHTAGIIYGDIFRAVYWKNNTAYYLPSDNHPSGASSIFVDGKDVYIAGHIDMEMDDDEFTHEYTAVYWKNNILHRLTDNLLSDTSSIIVIGGDVYISGQIGGPNRSIAGYWKNGQLIMLPQYRSVSSIQVSGSDLYILVDSDSDKKITYLKNGVAVEIPVEHPEATEFALVYPEDYEYYYQAGAGCLYVKGQDVYITGSIGLYEREEDESRGEYVCDVPFYIKNNRITEFPWSYDWESSLGDIFADDSSVYIVGTDAYYATIWQNGVEKELDIFWHPAFEITKPGQRPRRSEGMSLFVKERDVYAAGQIYGGGLNFAVYWKNGVSVALTDGKDPAYACAIVVTD